LAPRLLLKNWHLTNSGLPDDRFSNQNSQFGYVLEGLAMEDVPILGIRPFGPFCGQLAYFMVIWYILWSFGISYGHLVYFSLFGMFHQEKSGNPERDLRHRERSQFVTQ
jgi:hypothetical protein